MDSNSLDRKYLTTISTEINIDLRMMGNGGHMHGIASARDRLVKKIARMEQSENSKE